MFNGVYLESNFKKIKMILDHFGYPFFNGKSVLDLGCGHGDIGAAFYRLGSKVVCVDARTEHVKLAGKKHPGITTMCVDLDKEWPFDSFDIILDLDLVSHLKNFENHFRNVCNTTKHIVLECAVCDSDDPYYCPTLSENKLTYDQSFNGFSSRPTAAMVERILTELGFEFKRYDYSKLNLGKVIYDWRVHNTGTTDPNKRRFWIAKKKAHVKQVPTVIPLVDNNRPIVPVGKLQVGKKTSIYPALSAPPPPQAIVRPTDAKNIYVNNIHGFTYNHNNILNIDPIRNNSREFGLINKEKFIPTQLFDLSGVILPGTISSRMWFKKIANFFPGIQVSHLARTLFGFNKSNAEPTLFMCSINNIFSCNRIFIEEWSNYSLTEEDINILKGCKTIITPSLINLQELQQALPNSNIKRLKRPWPFLNTAPHHGNYHLYFEKNTEATKNLLEAWDPKLGKLAVVNSTVKLPDFAQFVSDSEDYHAISGLIFGARSIIDISDNNYYCSGIIDLAKSVNKVVVSNNTYSSEEGKHIIISQDKNKNILPGVEDIKASLNQLETSSLSGEFTYPTDCNTSLLESIKALLES